MVISKWPVTRKRLAVKQNRLKFRTWEYCPVKCPGTESAGRKATRIDIWDSPV